MRLQPKELDKLMLHYAGMLAKSRKERGIKLNYVEAVALISMEIMERARAGVLSVAELMSYGREILKASDVMDGVASLVSEVQVEATFPDGSKLVTIHNPMESNDKFIAGEIICAEGEITLNANRESIEIEVLNTGDRAIQVGSHFHFFEVNKALKFSREIAFGKRLDIASGTSVRFEPNEKKRIKLIDFGGEGRIYGFNDLTNEKISQKSKEKAIKKAKNKGFM